MTEDEEWSMQPIDVAAKQLAVLMAEINGYKVPGSLMPTICSNCPASASIS